MTKTVRKSLKKMVGYSTIYVLGMATVITAWWVTYTPPEKRSVISTHYLDIFDTGIIRTPVYEIDGLLLTGQAYLREPLYFLHRDKGLDALKRAASLGSLTAMGILQIHYLNLAYGEKTHSKAWALYVNKARDWGHNMAKAGDPMSMLLVMERLTTPLDENELTLLESYGKNYQKIAAALVRYYSGQYPNSIPNHEKAAFWKNHLESYNGFLGEPAEAVTRQYFYMR